MDMVPAGGGLFEAAPGGSPANVAVALARLDVPVRLLARLADDVLGRRLRRHLVANDVDLGYAVHAREPSSLAIVALDEHGVPEYDFRVDGTADWQWTDDELAGALDGPVVAVHSGSLALAREPGASALTRLLARARERAAISYDPNCRPLLMGSPEAELERVERLVALADVVKVSSEDLAWLVPGCPPEHVAADWLARGTVARGRHARPRRRVCAGSRRGRGRAAGTARRGRGHGRSGGRLHGRAARGSAAPGRARRRAPRRARRARRGRHRERARRGGARVRDHLHSARGGPRRGGRRCSTAERRKSRSRTSGTPAGTTGAPTPRPRRAAPRSARPAGGAGRPRSRSRLPCRSRQSCSCLVGPHAGRFHSAATSPFLPAPRPAPPRAPRRARVATARRRPRARSAPQSRR